MMPAFAGTNLIYGAGMLELGMTFSMEQLLIDNDIIGMVKKTSEGVLVNEETLSVAAIKKVGAGKNFLSHKTTMSNIDLPSNPMFFDRTMYGDWDAAGGKDILAVAHEKVNEVMATHEVLSIDSDILKDMMAIVEEGDKAFLASH